MNQGLVFNGSDRYSYAQFNTENVDTLSFTIGHVDNTTLSSATMTIYLDGKGEDEIALSSNMNLMEYTLDVSNTSVVRIYLDCSNYTDKSYALGDISMDSSTSVRPCVIPEYANAEEWLSDRFNTSNVAVYDGSEKTKSFNVNSDTYYQGITFKNSDRYSYAKFNTENLSNISFKIGHVDGTTSANSTMTIVVDNKEFDVLTLTADMTPLDYSLDVTDISTVRFYFDGSNYTDKTYALFGVYYNNEAQPSIEKLGLNCYESAFFTKKVVDKMLPKNIIKISIFIIIYIVLMIKLKNMDLLLVITQTLFSAEIIFSFIKLCYFKFQLDKVCNEFQNIFLIIGLKNKDVNILILDATMDYECLKSYCKISTSSKIFFENNNRWSKEWQKLLNKIKKKQEKDNNNK